MKGFYIFCTILILIIVCSLKTNLESNDSSFRKAIQQNIELVENITYIELISDISYLLDDIVGIKIKIKADDKAKDINEINYINTKNKIIMDRSCKEMDVNLVEDCIKQGLKDAGLTDKESIIKLLNDNYIKLKLERRIKLSIILYNQSYFAMILELLRH